MYIVKLINNICLETSCCGGKHFEVLAEFEHETLQDSMDFYNKFKDHYGRDNQLGEWLQPPVKK